MEKTRLLIVAPSGGFTNGADIAMNHQVLYLQSLGYKIFFARPAHTDEGFDEFLRAHEIDPFLVEYSYWDNFKLNPAYSSHHDLEATMRLIQYINENKIDLVISNTLNVPWGSLAAAFTNKPHIWLAHEFPENEFAYLKNKLAFIGKSSNALLASSQILAKDLKMRFEKLDEYPNISYFSPYTEKPMISDEVGKFPTRLVNVDAITPRKNQLELVMALEELSKFELRPELIFTAYINDQDYYQSLLDFLKTSSIKNQVKFLSDGNDNWKWVRTSDIVVSSSINETYGLTMIESLKVGLVTMASSKATLALKDNAYFNENAIYESGNIKDFTEKLKFLFINFESISNWYQIQRERVVEEQGIIVSSKALIDQIEAQVGKENPLSALYCLKDYFINGISEYSGVLRITLPELQHDFETIKDLAVARQEVILNYEKQIVNFETEIFRLQNSTSYKIGYALTQPFRKLRNLFKK